MGIESARVNPNKIETKNGGWQKKVITEEEKIDFWVMASESIFDANIHFIHKVILFSIILS